MVFRPIQPNLGVAFLTDVALFFFNNVPPFPISGPSNQTMALHSKVMLPSSSSTMFLPFPFPGPSNQTLALRSVAVLPCLAEGVPTPSIKWFKDGFPLSSSAGDNQKRITKLSSGTLQIANLQSSDSGNETRLCVSILGPMGF